jgi:hypothetical protein
MSVFADAMVAFAGRYLDESASGPRDGDLGVTVTTTKGGAYRAVVQFKDERL